MNDKTGIDTTGLATELTIAWLSNPNTRVQAEEVPAFLARMHQAVSGLSSPVQTTIEEPQTEHVAAVSVRKSLASPDHIVSMIDGKPYRTLRRHLTSNGLTPDEYRARYGLRSDYPMVAQSYSEQRSEMARRIGLGRKPAPVATAEPAPPPAPAEAPAVAPAGEAPKRRRSRTQSNG